MAALGLPDHTFGLSPNDPAWWSSTLSHGLPTNEIWMDEDRRFARGIYRLGFGSTIGQWVHTHCHHERPDQDVLAPVRASIVPEEADDGEFAASLILIGPLQSWCESGPGVSW